MSCPTVERKFTVCPDATPANRFCLDYAEEAGRMPSFPFPIIDVHTHIGGLEASKIFKRVSEQFGIGLTYSMTQLEQIEPIREIMEGRIRFIAVPNWHDEDRLHALGRGFIERLETFHELGVRICKFWAAPRSRDYAEEFGQPDFMNLDAPHRLEAMQIAYDLGMSYMVHVADPDTWFKAKYTDERKYGSKRSQYDVLEMVLERFDRPWIAAHFGGWPEDLEFLTDLLLRHENLYLDTSATKWIVREISRHSRDDVVDFLTRFRGRILFGSDIVTSDDHLEPGAGETEMQQKASSRDQAYDLYASRYYALRKLWESDCDHDSPIADPDLAMVDPGKYDELDAPRLLGKALPAELLKSLYHDAAHDLLETMHA